MVAITDVKTFIVHPGVGKNWLLVKVETDAGIHGWGESYTQADRDQAIEAHIHAMKRYVIGRDPFAIKHFTTVMYLDWAGKRGAMDFYCALSGIEQAMWDIAGKVAGQPVYNLLGGRCRDKIRVYANGWGDGGGSEARAEAARRVVARGFTALKFDPFPGPWREIIGRDQERQAVANVRAVREAVGPDVEILIEVHRRLAPVYAVRVARMMEEFDPFWYEEPVSSRNMPGLAAAKRQITIPVVTGEELYTKAEFRPVFELLEDGAELRLRVQLLAGHDGDVDLPLGRAEPAHVPRRRRAPRTRRDRTPPSSARRGSRATGASRRWTSTRMSTSGPTASRTARTFATACALLVAIDDLAPRVRERDRTSGR